MTDKLPTNSPAEVSGQMFWCAACGVVFIALGAADRIGGKHALRHDDCGVMNEIKVSGETEEYMTSTPL